MSTAPISMRKLKDILRLKYDCSLSHRQIAKSLSISPSVVSRYANRATQLGISDCGGQVKFRSVLQTN